MVGSELIRAVNKQLKIHLLVGGGIRTKEQLEEAYSDVGDMVVIVTDFEEYENLYIDLTFLYYIDENGEYIENSTYSIDLNQKIIVLYIDHFSRYAIGIEYKVKIHG